MNDKNNENEMNKNEDENFNERIKKILNSPLKVSNDELLICHKYNLSICIPESIPSNYDSVFETLKNEIIKCLSNIKVINKNRNNEVYQIPVKFLLSKQFNHNGSKDGLSMIETVPVVYVNEGNFAKAKIINYFDIISKERFEFSFYPNKERIIIFPGMNLKKFTAKAVLENTMEEQQDEIYKIVEIIPQNKNGNENIQIRICNIENLSDNYVIEDGKEMIFHKDVNFYIYEDEQMVQKFNNVKTNKEEKSFKLETDLIKLKIGSIISIADRFLQVEKFYPIKDIRQEQNTEIIFNEIFNNDQIRLRASSLASVDWKLVLETQMVKDLNEKYHLNL